MASSDLILTSLSENFPFYCKKALLYNKEIQQLPGLNGAKLRHLMPPIVLILKCEPLKKTWQASQS